MYKKVLVTVQLCKFANARWECSERFDAFRNISTCDDGKHGVTRNVTPNAALNY